MPEHSTLLIKQNKQQAQQRYAQEQQNSEYKMEATAAKLSLERHNHVVRASDTDHTFKIALTKEDFFSLHGDIQIRKKIRFGLAWMPLRSSCPRCDELEELKVLNEQIKIAKSLGLQGGQDSGSDGVAEALGHLIRTRKLPRRGLGRFRKVCM